VFIARPFFGNGDELFGMRVWKRVQQHAIDDGKKCGVRADPEGESKNGDRGEARRFEEHPKGVKHVL
jgi:hypothetical protein